MSKPQKELNVGTLTDYMMVGMTRALGSKEYQDLDIAILKATNHDEVIPKEKHCRTILETMVRGRSRDDVQYIFVQLSERLKRATEWLVVLKCLMVIHRILRETDDNIRDVLVKMQRRQGTSGGGSGLDLFNLSNFRDASSPEGWELSGLLRTYALYLEERVACFEGTGFDPESERTGSQTIRDWDTVQLVEKLPKLQLLLRRLVAVVPQGSGRVHPVVAAAVAQTFRDSKKVYRAISDGIVNLVDRFFDMPQHEAAQALDLYKRAMRQTDELQSAYRLLSGLDEFRSEKYPTLEKPPADFLTTMEQFVGAPPTKQQQPIRSAPAPASASAAPPSPPVLGTIQTGGAFQAQAAPDLLAFDDLTISAPAPAPAVAVPAFGAPPADPFAAVAAAPQQQQHHAPPPMAAAAPRDPFGLDFLSPAQQPAAPAQQGAVDLFGQPQTLPVQQQAPPVQQAPPPQQGLDKGALDSLYSRGAQQQQQQQQQYGAAQNTFGSFAPQPPMMGAGYGPRPGFAPGPGMMGPGMGGMAPPGMMGAPPGMMQPGMYGGGMMQQQGGFPPQGGMGFPPQQQRPGMQPGMMQPGMGGMPQMGGAPGFGMPPQQQQQPFGGPAGGSTNPFA